MPAFMEPRLAGSEVGVTPARRSRLRLLSDLRRSQTEASTVDFVRDDALMERFSNSVIQALQKRVDAFIVAAHECGDQLLIVDGDGCAFYRGNPPEHDVAAWTGEQRCDVWPAIFRVGR
jgi:hypothetical protein